MRFFSSAQTTKLRASASLIGTMIGVGVFGLPFVFVQAGFFVGMAYLLVLGLVTMTLQMMMAEVALQTPGAHRIAGYVQRYFGAHWALGAAFVMMAMSWGALIAYVLVGAEFLMALLHPWLGGDVLVYQVGLLIVGFCFALRGLAAVTRVETYLVMALVAVMVLLIVRSAFGIHIQHYTLLATGDVFSPYGVVLFSLGGVAIISEIKHMLGRYSASLRSVIPWSVLMVVALYACFVAAVVGVTGINTSPEAIVGLGEVFGTWVLIVGSLFGFLAVATSFLTTAISIQDLLEYDFGYTRLLAWFAGLSVPTLVILAGARNFIDVMRFTGSVFGGFIGIIAVALYLRVRARYCASAMQCFTIPVWFCLLILGVFILGVLSEVARSFI